MIIAFFALCLAATTASAAEAPPAQQIVGRLPYSNQWVFDEAESLLYFGVGRQTLSSQTVAFNHFDSDFGSKSLSFASMDYFTRLGSLASLEGNLGFRYFSIWARYSLGFAGSQGQLRDRTVRINSSVESSFLAVLMMRAGINLSYDRSSWIQPYMGVDAAPFGFRHSSSLSGAEAQGLGLIVGPVAGAHLPLFFNHRAGLFGEVRASHIAKDDKGLFSDGITGDVGLGFAF